MNPNPHPDRLCGDPACTIPGCEDPHWGNWVNPNAGDVNAYGVAPDMFRVGVALGMSPGDDKLTSLICVEITIDGHEMPPLMFHHTETQALIRDLQLAAASIPEDQRT